MILLVLPYRYIVNSFRTNKNRFTWGSPRSPNLIKELVYEEFNKGNNRAGNNKEGNRPFRPFRHRGIAINVEKFN
jgi:hypothetical protein